MENKRFKELLSKSRGLFFDNCKFIISGFKMNRKGIKQFAFRRLFNRKIMKPNLKILILEDNYSDADLIHRELEKSGFSFTSVIVQTREEYENALQNFNPDIILSDYSLPAFDAVAAFQITQNKFPHIPFIIVSGVIGEENAVELIKNGVTDYTLKDKLFTLSPKINRALKDTEERKEREIISEELKTQKEELRMANEELEKRVFDRTRELEDLNHELKVLNLSKDKILSVISHDLRNPLTALLIASDQLSQDIENHIFEKIQPFAKVIHRTTHIILQQLNELVDWAKMQTENTTLNPEKLHLVSGVDQSLELLKANALQKNIVLENKVPFDLYVNADSLMLRSILQNLVTNSIKYTLQGGLINVTAQPVDKMVEVCITDSGIGMEAATRENLFTNSNSTSVSGTNNEKGSGLGLRLVKDFVTQHGGTIQVESEMGKGTSIIFTVPGY
jgi:two-component system sensor histidine kinase/response regulator